MSIPAPKPATTPIPVQLSTNEFTAFIFPHLSMPKRGPKCKLGYHRVFQTYPAAALWHEGDGIHVDQPASILRCLKLATSYPDGGA